MRHALAESVRRVSSIALVHETLSTSPDDRVDLDQIVDRLVPMLSEVAAAESPARVRRDGSFGALSAELATPLVMVLAEIVQNALQHGYPPGSLGGEVTIVVERSARELDIRVVDDGRGLPAGFSLERGPGLGLQIVRTLGRLRTRRLDRHAPGSQGPGHRGQSACRCAAQLTRPESGDPMASQTRRSSELRRACRAHGRGPGAASASAARPR